MLNSTHYLFDSFDINKPSNSKFSIMKNSIQSLGAILLFLSFVFSSTELGAQSYTMSSGSITTCSGTVYDPGGTGDYPNSHSVITTIYPSTTGNKVRLTFSAIAYEGGSYDNLLIYDGNSTSSSLIGTYASGTPTITSTASDGSLTLRSYSDFSVTGSGFEASISCVTAGLVMSSGSIYECDAVLLDPGGTANYANNHDVTQTIYPDAAGNVVRLTFSSLDYEGSSYDNLLIYDGNSTSATLIGTYYNTTPTITSTAADGSLTLRSYSDGSVTRSGFEASISCVAAASPPTITNFTPSSILS